MFALTTYFRISLPLMGREVGAKHLKRKDNVRAGVGAINQNVVGGREGPD